MSMATNRMAAPPLPSRHPARRPGKTSLDTSNTRETAQRNIHVWEHSVTLYHGFDWQSSAENFLYLSRVIDKNLESTLCLLNAAIIFARLGEYNTASQILADAEPAGETMPLTMFVMGHVEFELGNFEKAEDSFKVALNSLNGRSQSYSHLGLDFTLKASHIQQDLRVFASRNNLYGFLGTLGALPADGIFNPPATSANAKPTTLKTRRSTDSGYVPSLGDHSTPTSPAISPIEGYFGGDQHSSWSSVSGIEAEAPVKIRHNSISEALEDVRAGYEQLQMPTPEPIKQAPGPPPMISLPATPEPSIKDRRKKGIGGFVRSLSTRPAGHVVSQSVDHSRHPALREHEPRDARVQIGETGDLASFIRELPRPYAKKPREAVIPTESTRDLAHFLSDPRAPALRPAGDDASVYSSDGQQEAKDIVADVDLHRMVNNNSGNKPEPLSPIPRRRFRDGVASLIVTPRDEYIRTAPSSIHRSASTSRSNTPALTALPMPPPGASTRSSSVRISPSNPIFPRKMESILPRQLLPSSPLANTKKLAKEKPDPNAPKKVNPNAPKMVPAEPVTNFTDFFPKFMAKRMSEW